LGYSDKSCNETNKHNKHTIYGMIIKNNAEYMFYASEIALKRLKEISILNLNAQKHTIFIAELEKIVFEE